MSSSQQMLSECTWISFPTHEPTVSTLKILDTNLHIHTYLNCFHSTGFITSKIACCGQGPYNGIGLCTIASNLCPDRNIFAFWDAFHPTERANRIIVRQILTGSPDYMSPMNLSTILALDART